MRLVSQGAPPVQFHYAQAIDLASKHDGTIDLLLTDVVLPGAILRRGVLTQRSSLIQKPFSAADLMSRVGELLAQSRQVLR